LPLQLALVPISAGTSCFDRQTVNGNASGVGQLELIEAAQKSALAAAARADQHDRFTSFLAMIDSMKDQIGVVGFDQVLNGDHKRAFVRANWRKSTRGSSGRNKWPPSLCPNLCNRTWTSQACHRP